MKGEENEMKDRVGEGQGILCSKTRGMFSDSKGWAMMVLSLCWEGRDAGWGWWFSLTSILKRG